MLDEPEDVLIPDVRAFAAAIAAVFAATSAGVATPLVSVSLIVAMSDELDATLATRFVSAS